MSISKFKLTGENTNLARVAQMILGPCTNVLRDVLRKEISPPDLEKKVRAYVAKTKKPLINQHQEALVYGHDYSKFDVTLLYFLLRNMCSIKAHSNKWGNNPCPGDKSVSANIDRIRLIRNEYGHNSERSISDTDFNNKYQGIKDIVQELEKYLGSSTKYQDEVKELETCLMDPTQSEKNIKELLDLHEKIKDISGDVKEMKNTVLPWNIKVIYGKDVLKWKEDDIFFVETHNFQAMLDKVKQRPFVMFVGVPGSGKTATARHIALLLQEKDGYEILPTKDIKDIETYCDPHNPQVFVIDDVLGVFGFDLKELEKLIMYKDRLNEPTMPETKILMTCREVVFKHEAFSGSFLSNEKHVVQLHSEENALNDQDKYDLFAKYNLDKDLLLADTLSKISKSFPYLCKLFSRKEELRRYGPPFFISPVPCIIELLDNMKKRNEVHYASLVLLMTNQNALSEKDFHNENTKYFDEMKFQVLKRCKVDPTTCSFYFIDALTEMVGTYTEQHQSGFTLIHDSMLEIIAYHFGRHSPELILKYMDSDYIANYIKPDKYKCRKRKIEEDKLEQTVNVMEDSDTVANEEIVHDLYIRLPESYYYLLVDRLFEDIRKGELLNVFENDTLKHPVVLQTFLDVLKSKPYLELFTVFLSDLEVLSQNPRNISKDYVFTNKIVSYLFNDPLSFPREDRYLLTNIRLICIGNMSAEHYMCVRVIDWVIFYGYNRILQHIIDQIIKNTKTVNDLFQTPFNDVNKDWHDSFPSKKSHFFKKRRESDINQKSASKCDVPDDESCYESCFESYSELCSESDISDEDYDESCSESDSSFDSVGMDTEPLIVEQRRLLNLGCCSGDILTFQTLLAYVDKDVLTSTSLPANEDTDKLLIVFAPSLIVASECGHLNILLELLKHGVDVNVSFFGESPLTIASLEGHLDIVLELLKHGADVDSMVSYNTPLINACSKGHLDIVLELIKHGADVNITDSHNSPLIVACEKGHLDIVLELIKHEADVNITVSNNSPLIAACSKGHFDIVLELLKHNADVNNKDSSISPLAAACRSGHLDMVLYLLKHEANVNRISNYPPLRYACLKGNFDLVRELIKHGADVNGASFCDSPLTTACEYKHLDIVLYLLKHGADVNMTISFNSSLYAAISEGHLNIVLELIKHGADVNNAHCHQSPLILACEKGHLDIVLELLKHGADVNLTVSYKSPLIAACSEGRLEIVLELLKHGADVNITVSDDSPLVVAGLHGHLDIVLELLKHGADVNLTVSDTSPLIVACANGRLNIVLELLKYGADVNLTVSYKSPLIKACANGRLNIVLELLKYGADVNITTSESSPLLTACKYGHLDIVLELLKHEADVNTTVSDKSPFIVACQQRHLDIVLELLEHGVDVNITFFNKSLLIDACSKGHLYIVRQLLKHGADVNITNSYCSPLIKACLFGSLKIVRQLLKHGADVNVIVWYKSPLLAACSKGYLDIISLLLKHGADVNIKVSGRSPLTASCQINYRAMKYNLSNKAAYANTISNDTLFRLSCSKVHLVIIRKLLQHGADVNAKDCEDSPLNASCSKGHLNIVRELLKHGADVNFIADYSSPLITACQKGHLDIVGQLIRHGANVNIKVAGTSPLIAACSEGRLDIVLKLLKHGADVQMRVSDNSPLLAARSRKHLDIVSELLKHGANY